MAKRKDKPKRNSIAPDITPMIDVTFMLLIFFIVATRFKEAERLLDARLPQTSGPSPGTNLIEKLDIRITRNGDMTRVSAGRMKTRDVPLDAPDRVLDRVYTGMYGDLVRYRRTEAFEQTLIDADRDIPWAHVAMALNACKRAGMNDVSFQAKKP